LYKRWNLSTKRCVPRLSILLRIVEVIALVGFSAMLSVALAVGFALAAGAGDAAQRDMPVAEMRAT
jgi:hypothetical protein